MRKYLYIFGALLVGIFTSCSKSGITDKENYRPSASFNVSVDGSLRTKGEEQEPSRYVMEIYKGLEATGTPVEHREQATGTFTDVLIAQGQGYTVLFWADYGTPTAKDGSPAESNDYDVTDLKAAKVATGKIPSNAAFAGVSRFTPGVDDEAVYTKVTLTHAVAQVCFRETETLLSASNTLVVKYPESYSLNLDNMTVTKIAGEVTHTFSYNSQESGLLGTSYLIAASESQTVMDITATFNTETVRSVTNVPFQRNRRTNIKGAYSNFYSAALTFECDNEWAQPDMEKPLKVGIKVSATLGANGAPVYEIYTAAGLKAFADIINGAGTAYETDGIKIPATSSEEQRKSNAILNDNLDLSEICDAKKGNWKPIGGKGIYPYSGTFDGNGKTIKNLYINEQVNETSETKATDVLYGFFGYAKNATIKNLTIGGSIVVDNKRYMCTITAGGICSYLVQSTLINCHSSVLISIKLTNISSDGNGGVNAGGIVGSIYYGAIIKQSTSSSVVITEFNAPNSNYGIESNAGGIAGFSYQSSVINCHHSTGTVSAYSDNYRSQAGGIIGYAREGEVYGCVNNSSVQGKGTLKESRIGGICGYSEESKVVACYNTGGVMIPVETVKYCAGGISGNCYKANIIACYSIGNITDNASGATSSYKGGLVGGFAFNSESFVSQCWFIGTSGNGIGYTNSTNTDGGYVGSATALNSKIAGMNTAIKTYNDAAEADKKCLFHFIDGADKSPVLEAGTPN